MRLEHYLEAASVHDEEDGPMPSEQDAVVRTLAYAVSLVKDHRKNLLHVYALAEKT